MLHELFIILSGHPSPLFAPNLPPTFPLVSPAERTLLNSLAHLGNLHISLRQQCSQLVSIHPSTIARAIASAIDAHHLQQFRGQVVQVEASILRRESGVVGGYDIVALARIKSDFEGWDRILQYLEDLTSLMLGGLSVNDGVASKDGNWVRGAHLINRLRKDIHTGYPSLEQVSLHLLQVAETAWLRQISTWVLYGRLPAFGSEDFYIKEKDGDGQRIGDSDVMLKEYTIDRKLLPEFVTPEAASSVLFIGRSLSHIRARGGASLYTPASKAASQSGTSAAALSVTSPELGLLTTHLSILQTLQSPLSPQKFSTAISAIRLSLSRHTLQTLLPAYKIVEVLYVFREFFLLGRGEFAIALVSQADEKVLDRYRGKSQQGLVSSSGTLLKEGEAAAILTRAWGILSSYQSEEVLDERLEHARELLYLSIHKPTSHSSIPFPSAKKTSAKDKTDFSDFLVGSSVSLNFQISWPMELFLTHSDVDKYDRIFHYLIASRKCLISLQSLWHGRRHSMAIPGLIHDRAEANRRREKLKRRAQRERFIWATASLAVFFLETLAAYWQEEVIETSFNRFISLVRGTPEEHRRKRKRVRVVEPEREMDNSSSTDDDDGSDDNDEGSSVRIQKDTQTVEDPRNVPEQQQDPESLARAHRLYLNFLIRGLFLSDHDFTSNYRILLEACERLCTWISRLEKLHALADLGVDASSTSADDQSQVSTQLASLDEACKGIRKSLGKLVERLHGIDEERSKGAGALVGLLGMGVEDGSGGGGKIDRLLMRLNWDSMGGGDLVGRRDAM